jgi:hypothetical protein
MTTFVFLVHMLVNGVLHTHVMQLQAITPQCAQEQIQLAAINQALISQGEPHVFFGECRHM